VGSARARCFEAIGKRLSEPAPATVSRTTVLERAFAQQLTTLAAEVGRLRDQASATPLTAASAPDAELRTRLLEGNVKVLEKRLARAVEENEQLKAERIRHLAGVIAEG
jgi:hypothetical protein